MKEDTRIVAKIKAQISKFLRLISKVKRKLIKEMIYGVQATKDVKLSNICRSLNEDQALIKTESLIKESG